MPNVVCLSTYPYYTKSVKKLKFHSNVLGPNTGGTVSCNPKTKAHHLVLPVTLCCTCAAGVASKKIHSANGLHTLRVQCSQSINRLGLSNGLQQAVPEPRSRYRKSPVPSLFFFREWGTANMSQRVDLRGLVVPGVRSSELDVGARPWRDL